MAIVNKKNFNEFDELREPDKARIELLNFPAGTVGRFTLQPGWKWTESVGPIAGTKTCQAPHLGLVIKGSLTIFGDDNSEETFEAGDAYQILPGHTAQVNGDEESVCFEFDSSTAQSYAK